MNDENANLFKQALSCLLLKNPQEKVVATMLLQKDWLAGKLIATPLSEVVSLSEPGRPVKPELVNPRDVPPA